MFRHFDVYNEYGVFVGRYNVAPDCATSIGLTISLTLFYVVYAYIRVLIEGMIALFTADWSAALKCLGTFAVVTAILAGIGLYAHVPPLGIVGALAFCILLYASISAWIGIFAFLQGDLKRGCLNFLPAVTISVILTIAFYAWAYLIAPR